MEKEFLKSDMWGTCIWGIDEAGRLFIGDGVAASLADREAPWYIYREEIKEVETFGNVMIPKDASLHGLFKDFCNLERANLKSFDTAGAVDMSSMFENCEKLRDADLSSFNTSNVKNMNRMFYGCRALANLDLTSFNTTNVNDMTGMFSKCGVLHSIAMTEKFSLLGDGTTSCGNISVRDTGRYKIGKVVSAGSFSVVYNENYGRKGRLEKKAIHGMKYVFENMMFSDLGDGYVFTGWNTAPDGSGEMYKPGDFIEKIEDDIELYATWVGLPRVGRVQTLNEIEYGQTIPFELPEIISENDKSVIGFLEISPNGEDGTWQPMERNAILPTSYNGYLIRLCVKNSVGSTVSNAVRLRIRKAGIDMSKVHWVELPSMTYDGMAKRVWLEGLPEGVTARYSDNEAVEVGDYTATVTLKYDAENYSIPVKIRDHNWSIHRASYDMSTVHWDYEEAFTYDGTMKTVSLAGIPEGVEVTYYGNTAVDAGVNTATVTFAYDEQNFERPADVIPCIWEIKKAMIDTNYLKWSEYNDFVYDGTLKSVRLVNLPSGAKVEYSGEQEIQAGKYLARANIIGNYYPTKPIEYEWEIAKAQYDMSEVKWLYTEPFTYDGQIHEVKLMNVPQGLKVSYYNNVAQRAGDYLAKAAFLSTDTHNFSTPGDMSLLWSIKRAVVNMGDVKWNYSEPFSYDGEIKSISLMNLPSGVFALYENNTAANAGIYNAHAILKYDADNFDVEQPADCQWQINKSKFDISDMCWNYEKPFTYDGAEKGIRLINIPEGLNVEYTDNRKMDAGKYVATAKLTPSDAGNYECPEINGCTWSIGKKKLERGEIKWSEYDSFVYDGSEKEVKIVSDIDDKIRIEYVGNKSVNAGDHVAVAKFFPVDNDNFEAPTEATYNWHVNKGEIDMSDVVWDYTSPFNYNGAKQSVKLLNVPEGVIVHYSCESAVDVGRYVAVARFELSNSENFNEIEKMTLNWSIQKANYDLSEMRWQEERSFVYSGESKSIELKGIPAGLTPIYTNNTATDVAEYVASVDFMYDELNFEKPSFGSCRWKIEKADFDPGTAMWDYDKEFIYDGSEKAVKIINIPEGSRVEYTNARATEAGTYMASAEMYADDTGNYNNIVLEPITWKIAKGEYDMSYAYWDYENNITYDGTEKRVVIKGLPEGVYPVYYNNTAVDAGEYEAKVMFNVADSENYNIPQFESCRWTIKKADFDISAVQWSYTGEFVYNGRMREIVLKGLPDGVRTIYDGNCATNAGVYKASARLLPFNDENYNEPLISDCNWEIVKADYDMSSVRWEYTDAIPYIGREQTIELENLPNGIIAKYTGNKGTDVGRYMAKANLSVMDPANYNIPSVGNCEWEIGHAEYDMSRISWTYEPGMFVYDGKKKRIFIDNLPEGLTATYRGNTATEAGHYIASANFAVDNPNFRIPESINFDWDIDRADVDVSDVKWNYVDEFTYNGKYQGIALENVPEELLPAYNGNRAKDAGEYMASVSFTPANNNYNAPEGTSCKWVINKANIDISDIRWDYDKPFTYDGETKTVELAGVSPLLTVSYTGNTAITVDNYVAHAALYPVDDANYNAPVINDCRWEIVKTVYDMSNVRWVNDGPFTYDGTPKGVYLAGLPEGITPVYTDASASNAGRYNASVSFVYDDIDYMEPRVKDCEWHIHKNVYDMSHVKWNYSEAFVYDGTTKTVELEGLPDGVVPVYSGNSNTEAGTYSATVTFRYDELNYEKPKFDGVKWQIDKADIAVDPDLFGWTYTDAYTYDGTEKSVGLAMHELELSFMDKLRGRTPIKKLSGVPDGVEAFYDENEKTEVGVYYAKAVLKHTSNDNYNDYIVDACPWEIKKAEIDTSGIRWNYTGPFTYDGKEKSVELVGVPDTLTVSYVDNVAAESGSHEAQAILELKDPDNYMTPVPVKSCYWVINKAVYDMSNAEWAYDGNIEYNGKEKTVRVVGLPEGVRIEAYNGNKAIEAGTYTAEAIFKVRDRENYELPEMPALRWRIHKKKIDTDDIAWNYDDDSYFVYDGEAKEVKLTGVPKGVEVSYVNNSKVKAGTYVARAKLTYDTRNYDANPIPECKWKIEKANIDTSKVQWNYTKPFKYDAKEKSVTLKNVPSEIDVRYRDNKAMAVGSYTAKAYLTYDKENYNAPVIESMIDWEIIRVHDEDK